MEAGPAGDDGAMGDAAEPPLSDALRMLLEEPADKHDRRIARAKARNRTVPARASTQDCTPRMPEPGLTRRAQSKEYPRRSAADWTKHDYAGTDVLERLRETIPDQVERCRVTRLSLAAAVHLSPATCK